MPCRRPLPKRFLLKAATIVLMCIRRSSGFPIPEWKCVIQSTFTSLSSLSKIQRPSPERRIEAGKFPLDSRTVRIIGRSLAGHLSKRTHGRAPRIVIGRDTRESGVWIEQDLVAGARSEGTEVESAGIITTPGIAFLARTLPADAGVVISASHNAYQDNGIKVF